MEKSVLREFFKCLTTSQIFMISFSFTVTLYALFLVFFPAINIYITGEFYELLFVNVEE